MADGTSLSILRQTPLSSEIATKGWTENNFLSISAQGTLQSLSDIYILSGEVVEGLSNVVIPKLDTISGLVEAEVDKVDEISARLDDYSLIGHSHVVSDITDFPPIPTVNNGTLTIQKNGSTVQTFTANQSSSVSANIIVPTKTSDLTNDSGYVVSSDLTKVMEYQGSVETYENLPVNAEKGDVYNVISAHGDYPPGTNYAKGEDGWDPLGGSIDVSKFAEVSALNKLSSEVVDGLSVQINPKLSVIADMVEEEVVKLDELSGKLSGYALKDHTHSISSITNLQTTLDSKISAVTINGSKKTPTNGIVNLGTVISAHQSLSSLSNYLPLSGGCVSDDFYLSSNLGNGGYFLTNAGRTLGLGSTATGSGANAYGWNATAAGHESLAVGFNAKVQNAYNVDCVAIGFGAVVNAGTSFADGAKAIQIGYGTNTNPGSTQIFNWTLLDSNGDIPEARVSSIGYLKDLSALYSQDKGTKLSVLNDGSGILETTTTEVKSILTSMSGPWGDGGTGTLAFTSENTYSEIANGVPGTIAGTFTLYNPNYPQPTTTIQFSGIRGEVTENGTYYIDSANSITAWFSNVGQSSDVFGWDTPTPGGMSMSTFSTENKSITGITVKTIATLDDIQSVGTLNTTLTSSLSTNSNESLTGTIDLHKISKTGSWNDLLNKPTSFTPTSHADMNGSYGKANDSYYGHVKLSDTLTATEDLDTAGHVAATPYAVSQAILSAKNYADENLSNYLPLTGGTLSGNLNIVKADGSNLLSGLNSYIGLAISEQSYAKSSSTGSSAQSAAGLGQPPQAIAIGYKTYATGNFAVALGGAARAEKTGTIAIGSYSTKALSSYSIAIGHSAQAQSNYAIQLGKGTNNTVSSLQVYNYQLLDSAGNVPYARLSSAIDPVLGNILSALQEINGTTNQ